MMVRAPDELRDPWVLGGLALLALLSLAVVLLYSRAPQSIQEARTGTWLAARPNAYGPNLARARVLLQQAQREGAAGNDSAAVAADSLAAEHAARAGQLASDSSEAAAALSLWADALLDWAARLQRAGTGRGLRRDDNDLLRRALALVERVSAAAVPPPTRARAQALHAEIQRRLRPGPLEWLPAPR